MTSPALPYSPRLRPQLARRAAAARSRFQRTGESLRILPNATTVPRAKNERCSPSPSPQPRSGKRASESANAGFHTGASVFRREKNGICKATTLGQVRRCTWRGATIYSRKRHFAQCRLARRPHTPGTTAFLAHACSEIGLPSALRQALPSVKHAKRQTLPAPDRDLAANFSRPRLHGPAPSGSEYCGLFRLKKSNELIIRKATIACSACRHEVTSG